MRSWIARLTVIGALVWVPVTAGADGPPEGVSGEVWAGIQDQIEAERHRVVESDRPGRLWRADNAAQRFTAHFGAEDVVLVPRGGGEPAWQLGLRLTAWGAEHDLQPVPPAGAVSEGNRVEYRRGPLTEWYVNTTMGLEQGFTIEVPPADDIAELVLEISLEGDLTAQLAASGKAVTFRHDATNATLAYSGLAAWDSFGTGLEARMEVGEEGTRLRLVVSVTGAAWPITVDPIFSLVTKLLPTPEPYCRNAYFGQVLAMSGDHLVVSFHDKEVGAYSGAAHVFRRDQGGANVWGHVQKISAADGSEYASFGWSLAISGDTVIVGAKDDDDHGTDSGSAYIFERDFGGPDAWGQVAKITPADGAQNDNFGNSVAISGDTVVVGAYLDDDLGQNSGSTYIFERDFGGPDAWGQVAKITPTDGILEARFGRSVAIIGDTVVIGANLDSNTHYRPGSAYVFQRDHGGPNAWGQVKKITPDDANEEHRFGTSVDISADTAIIGARGDDDNGPGSGAAYIFRRDEGGVDNWGLVKKIVPADGEIRAYFGTSVRIDGDTAIIGAFADDAVALDSGSAYVFRRDQGGVDTWGLVKKIIPADGFIEDVFGGSVAIEGDTVAAGAGFDDDNGPDSGSVYIFQRDQGGPGNWGQIVKHPCPPWDAAWGHGFGSSVSIDGDTIAVGAFYEYINGSPSGSAYVFQRSGGGLGTWVLNTRIGPSDGGPQDRFGNAISVYGDTIVVGAYRDIIGPFPFTQSGSAYLFQRDSGGPNAWGQVAKVTANDAQTNDQFGVSVAISGDIVVVGADQDDDAGVDSGSVYVLQRDYGGPNAWGQVAKLTLLSGTEGDHFGRSVAIVDDTAIVGAPDTGTSGAAFVFRRDHGGSNAWGQVAQITPDGGTLGEMFGASVALNGGHAMVGAPGDGLTGQYPGSAHVFGRDHGGPDAWGQIAKVIANDGNADDLFGISVSISGDSAVVGAQYDDGNGIDSGSVYMFRRNQGGPDAWGQTAKIRSVDGETEDYFGQGVAISGEAAVVGAVGNVGLGWGSGAAYVYFIAETLFVDDFETGNTFQWSVTIP